MKYINDTKQFISIVNSLDDLIYVLTQKMPTSEQLTNMIQYCDNVSNEYMELKYKKFNNLILGLIKLLNI